MLLHNASMKTRLLSCIPGVVAGVVLGFMVSCSTPAQASIVPHNDPGFLASVNSIRQQHGLKPLRWDSRLANVAYSHVKAEAQSGTIWHNDSDIPSYGYYYIGQNVGKTNDPTADESSIMEGFMLSPTHRANILDKTYVAAGVEVVEYKGLYYLDLNFGGYPLPKPTPKAAPTHKPKAAPVVVDNSSVCG